jgi:hypothetical protein
MPCAVEALVRCSDLGTCASSVRHCSLHLVFFDVAADVLRDSSGPCTTHIGRFAKESWQCVGGFICVPSLSNRCARSYSRVVGARLNGFVQSCASLAVGVCS